jgi:hypothetical protein
MSLSHGANIASSNKKTDGRESARGNIKHNVYCASLFQRNLFQIASELFTLFRRFYWGKIYACQK